MILLCGGVARLDCSRMIHYIIVIFVGVLFIVIFIIFKRSMEPKGKIAKWVSDRRCTEHIAGGQRRKSALALV